jgi:indole-3-glycerol phosphate synthase
MIMTASILEKIVKAKKMEVATRRRAMPVQALKERLASQKRRDFTAALQGGGLKLIAEVKSASPSKGILVKDFNHVTLAMAYESGGAAAISILTEAAHFQGHLDYLAAIREKVGLPLLRKDFIFDEYQIYESAAFGADALLLIAAILDVTRMRDLLALSLSLGLACLVEVHNETELESASKSGAEIIGINNRDLNTFQVDIETTRRLRPLVPAGKIVVSESGISTRDDVARLKAWGVSAILVGEALVTAPDTSARIKELLS